MASACGLWLLPPPHAAVAQMAMAAVAERHHLMKNDPSCLGTRGARMLPRLVGVPSLVISNCSLIDPLMNDIIMTADAHPGRARRRVSATRRRWQLHAA